MNIFLLGLAIFFVPHLFSSFRDRSDGKDLRRKIGYNTYMGIYSVITLVGLVLMIKGFGEMRPAQVLYEAPSWGMHLNLIFSFLALIFFIAANFPTGHIKKTLKHPMLVGVKLWAVGHLLSNGELNSVMLFGAFLAYAVIDRIAVKRRGDLGPVAKTPHAKWDILSVTLGVFVTLIFVYYVHPNWIGVPVLP